jgi:histidyl-tRNA synthetase
VEQEVVGATPTSCTKTMNKKISKPSVDLPGGFVDRKEKELVIRDFLIKQIKEVMTKYGFEFLETPSFEYTESLGKFLPDKDRPSEGVFSFEDGKKWLSLRYDLTAPLARFSAKNFDNLPRPFKRYQLGTVWRNEKPGPGRYREFLQFDADYVGTNNLLSDAELCVLISEILEKCGLANNEFNIKISNRKLSKGLLEELNIKNESQQATSLRAIDKLDRVGIDGVKLLLGQGRKDKSGDFTEGAKLEEKQIDKIIEFLNSKGLDQLEKIGVKNKLFEEGIKELKQIVKNFELFNFKNFKIDPAVVRGLEYYTGPIFEAELTFKVKNEKGIDIEFGSIGGGGRYDDLVKRFKNQDCPATGISIGLDRLLYALTQKNIFNFSQKNPVLICVLDEKYMDYYFKILNLLRSNNINSEIYSGSSNFKAQLKYADKRNCKYAIICGDDEVSKEMVTLKNLEIGSKVSEDIKSREDWKQSKDAQKTFSFSDLVKEIKK